MFLKLLWFLIILWIAHRVIEAGRNLFHIASGRTEPPLSGPAGFGPGPGSTRRPDPADFEARRAPTDGRPVVTRPAASVPSPSGARDVEDARFEDLP